MIHLGRAYCGGVVWETWCGRVFTDDQIVKPLAPEEERMHVNCPFCAEHICRTEAQKVAADVVQAFAQNCTCDDWSPDDERACPVHAVCSDRRR